MLVIRVTHSRFFSVVDPYHYCKKSHQILTYNAYSLRRSVEQSTGCHRIARLSTAFGVLYALVTS
jgi:hypothetical protein